MPGKCPIPTPITFSKLEAAKGFDYNGCRSWQLFLLEAMGRGSVEANLSCRAMNVWDGDEWVTR
jgi:hypothetical protein